MKKPIENPPPPVADRPKCPNCGKTLQPRIHERLAEIRTEQPELHTGQFKEYYGSRGVSFELKPSGKYWTGEYESYGVFCTLRCGCAFGNAAYKAGYRVKTD